MELRDPKRPLINHHPAIVDSKGKAVFPFTGVTVDIVNCASGNCRCSFMAKNPNGAYSWQTIEFRLDYLKTHLMALDRDPEYVMRMEYNYTPPEGTHLPPKPTPPTLEDLGLA